MLLRLKSALAALALWAMAITLLSPVPARAQSLCGLTFGLLGCDEYKPSGQPSFYQSMATADAKVDAKAAASMISGYRRNNGLGLVKLDEKLMHAAEEQARA